MLYSKLIQPSWFLTRPLDGDKRINQARIRLPIVGTDRVKSKQALHQVERGDGPTI